ncbi:ankyrin repeat domain-containing protein [Ancylomarina sp. 16SWW S1-10-2]|uniref:ankyrin repeat domain-containing protein n=1 Tax=Ancylomarina sp. 16SWW S1-10-2 TaxID=2499681 RepID=UPI0012ADE783|nr:ankyrin repeat domain-containing protein [Ancylomarina sp. 16SWW S1-10-2]MRT93515.1 ankyrin repeat domain-containing protein [Ancylomarina sp. 16SWW S1-10-2]
MNKLQLFAAIATMGICTYGCNTKPSKVSGANDINTEKTTPTSVKTFDNDLIMQSALDGKIEVVKDALSKGFNANTTDPNKRTPLMLAAYNGHNEIVKLLIDNGADVNLTDNVNRTALMFASTGLFAPTVTTLLEAGSKPNMIDSEQNWTAAMMAASEGQLEVLKVLVAHGADLKMLDIDGESSLDFANSNGHPAVAQYIKTQLK